MMRLSSFKTALLLLTANLSCFYPFCEAVTVLPPTDMSGTQVKVAADNNSHAVAIFLDSNLIGARYSPGNLTWGPAVIISDAIGIKLEHEVAMDASSTALAIWRGLNVANFTIETNRLSGGIWGVPEVLEGPTANSIAPPSIAMNGSGGGIAAWANRSLNEMHASFFTAGVWQPFQSIGPSLSNGVGVSYSANGNAVAVWNVNNGTSDILAATSIGLSWQPFTLLDTLGSGEPKVGMDANGNAIALWAALNPIVADLKWSRFDDATATWSTPQIIDTPVQSSFDIAVAPNGTAVAIWTVFSGGLEVYYSQFNGTAWSPRTFISQGNSVRATMDSEGNALISWVTANVLNAARLPLGGVLESPFIISSGVTSFTSIALSSGSSLGIAGFNNFAAFFLFDPAPSTGITGSVCKNSFAMQSDRVHIISWDPSTDPTTVSYYIYRNGVLISIVPASGPFTFHDHNRTKGVPDTYTVIAINGLGVQSTPVSITLD